MKKAWCCVSVSPMRKENSDRAEMVSQLLFGEVVEVMEVADNWTRIVTFYDHYEAWVDTKHLIYLSEKEMNRWMDGLGISQALTQTIQTPWGLQQLYRGSYVPESNETEFKIGNHTFRYTHQESATMFRSGSDFARSYLNTPYLWGGKSPFGIDCSGFTQQVFRFLDKQLPRDAYQQEELGATIAFEDRQEGDLAFFVNASGKVTHVGLLLEDLRIIHASGWVRIDDLRPTGIWNAQSEKETHQLHTIKRI